MIDVLLLLILAGVTYYVASEGAWGAATTAMSVIAAPNSANKTTPVSKALQVA